MVIFIRETLFFALKQPTYWINMSYCLVVSNDFTNLWESSSQIWSDITPWDDMDIEFLFLVWEMIPGRYKPKLTC
jgi:hypothetical protein